MADRRLLPITGPRPVDLYRHSRPQNYVRPPASQPGPTHAVYPWLGYEYGLEKNKYQLTGNTPEDLNPYLVEPGLYKKPGPDLPTPDERVLSATQEYYGPGPTNRLEGIAQLAAQKERGGIDLSGAPTGHVDPNRPLDHIVKPGLAASEILTEKANQLQTEIGNLSLPDMPGWDLVPFSSYQTELRRLHQIWIDAGKPTGVYRPGIGVDEFEKRLRAAGIDTSKKPPEVDKQTKESEKPREMEGGAPEQPPIPSGTHKLGPEFDPTGEPAGIGPAPTTTQPAPTVPDQVQQGIAGLAITPEGVMKNVREYFDQYRNLVPAPKSMADNQYAQEIYREIQKDYASRDADALRSKQRALGLGFAAMTTIPGGPDATAQSIGQFVKVYTATRAAGDADADRKTARYFSVMTGLMNMKNAYDARENAYNLAGVGYATRWADEQGQNQRAVIRALTGDADENLTTTQKVEIDLIKSRIRQIDEALGPQVNDLGEVIPNQMKETNPAYWKQLDDERESLRQKMYFIYDTGGRLHWGGDVRNTAVNV